MSFSLLGPLEVRVGDQPVAITGTRRRALLVRLLVDANRVVPAERLIEDLWATRLPDQPAAALQASISHLRAALTPAGPSRPDRPSVLLTRPPGYLVTAAPEHLDTMLFVQRLAEGRAALASGRPADASAQLGQALLLRRGPALGELASEPWARAEAARLEELHWDAVESRMQADLALGRHAAVAAEAEAALAEQPLRERLWAHRMLALYRCGRQSEALRTYTGLRRALGEELGIGPSPDLGRLEEAILRHDPALDWRPAETEQPPPGRRAPAAVPPPRLGSRPTPLVGRHHEMEGLRRAWAAARQGRQAVLLVGEPGVGKSRLAMEMAELASAEGAVVLAGRCDEGMGVPYQPFVEALRHFVDTAGDTDLLPSLGPSAGELTRLLHDLAGRLPQLPVPLSSDPETERYRLFLAIAGWLAAASRAGPVLLVLDDLHWATTTTLLLLRHILRSSQPMQLLIVTTHRDTELSRQPSIAGLLEEVAREPDVHRLHLAGLGEAEVAELVAASGAEPAHDSTALARAVHRETRGNPFFVGEVVRQLIETGRAGEGRWAAADATGLGIPAGARAVIADRLSRLAPATREVLAVAAAAGPEFELPVLRIAAGTTGEALIEALEEAADAHLVEEVPGLSLRYHFVHALVRTAIYAEASRARRVHQHRRLGEAIEAFHAGHLEPHVAELAGHFDEAAADGDTEKASRYHHAAGDAALAQLANDDAARHYQRALDFLRLPVADDEEVGTRRARLLVRLGEAQRRSGDAGYRATLLQGAWLAQDLGHAELLTEAALANNRGFFSVAGVVDAERVSVLEQALATQGGGDSAERARLLAQLGTELIFAGDWAARVSLSDQALSMARRLGEPATLVHVLNLRFVTMWGAPTVGERVAMTAEARALSGQLADPVPAFYASCFGAHAALEVGDVAAARRLLDAACELATSLGQPILDWYTAVTGAKLGSAILPPAEVEPLVLHALSVGQDAGQPDALLWATVQLNVLRRHQGRTAELVPLIESAYSAQPFAGSVPMWTQASLAASYGDVGRTEEARALLTALVADGFEGMPCDFGWLAVAALAAHTCWTLGGCAGAEAIYEMLDPYRGQFVDSGPGWLGSVAHYLGLVAAALGWTEEADAAFAQAVEAHARLGARTWLAVTQSAWAGFLGGSGSPERAARAQVLWQEAQASASDLGMVDLERQACSGLAALAQGRG